MSYHQNEYIIKSYVLSLFLNDKNYQYIDEHTL